MQPALDTGNNGRNGARYALQWNAPSSLLDNIELNYTGGYVNIQSNSDTIASAHRKRTLELVDWTSVDEYGF